MARKKNSEKSVTSNNDTRPETRKEKRERLARKRAKLAEHKKLVPVLVVGCSTVMSTFLSAVLCSFGRI